jgi:hypothetical protein
MHYSSSAIFIGTKNTFKKAKKTRISGILHKKLKIIKISKNIPHP